MRNQICNLKPIRFIFKTLFYINIGCTDQSTRSTSSII